MKSNIENCTTTNSNEIQNTINWFKQAIPDPTIDQACIQIGCHIEEFSEMATAMGDNELATDAERIADRYKSVTRPYKASVKNVDERGKSDLLDSLVDQIVTATGVCHMMGFDLLGALAEVNRSNFSKFEDGKPVFDCGKISKGRFYTPPNLTPFIGNCNED